ncbi:maf-like protein [Pyrus ussuriensis x Pyrus communis]|uniref:Maf-like protein n=1 Tax=Pyrus ussuriensis x Pyrus communis TaxID=2448454 RepID=A0A5N5H0D9_9ROSA|nr:maf-like protein [Pyrus ussuriensis x Pyrus communis]
MEADSSSFKIILGSGSIARRKILAEMGYEFTVMTADIDEKSIRTEKPEELVLVLAKAKADAIVSKLQSINNQEKDAEPTIVIAADTLMETSQAEAISQRLPVGDYIKDAEPTLLITSDQVVVYEGVIREKPSSKEEARQFLKGWFNGYLFHTILEGMQQQWDLYMLQTLKRDSVKENGIEWRYLLLFLIYFHKIPDEVIEKLIEEGIVLKVAGGLITEHPLILPFVKEVVGTTDSVMGLPIDLTRRLLKEAV